MAVSLYEEHRPRENKITVTSSPDFSGDYVATGAADQLDIIAAIAELTAGRTGKETVKVIGDFTIDAPILVPNYTILDLTEAYIFLANGSDCNMIENDDQDNGNIHITIIGGVLNGNRANQAVGNGVDWQFVTFSRILTSTITNVYGRGIFLHTVDTEYTQYVLVQGCQLIECDIGISMLLTRHIQIVANEFQNNLTASLRASSLAYSLIDSNDFRGNPDPLPTYAINFESGWETVIVGNLITTHMNGMYGNFKQCVIVGNHLDAIGNAGINISSNGFNTVTGNTLSDCSYNVGGTQPYIKVTTDLNIIANNQIYGIDSYKPLHGIQCEGDNNVIEGNTIDNTAENGILLEGAVGCVVTGNRITRSGTYGIKLDDGTDDTRVVDNFTSGSSTGCVNIANANCDDNDFSGGNTFLEGGFVDAGTGTILPTAEWLCTYGEGGISLNGDVPLAPIINGQTAVVGFFCPPELRQLVRAYLMVLPNVTQANADWDLDSDYGAVGEAPNIHGEADAGTTYNVTNLQWYDIELVVLGFFANLAVGDRGGIKLTVSTDGHNVSVFALRFEYV